jgi:hypothetical protein
VARSKEAAGREEGVGGEEIPFRVSIIESSILTLVMALQ